MKSILYVGITLMLGASIYGFVDYNQTNHRKEFKEMYEPAKMEAPVVEEKKLPVTDERAGIMESKKISAEIETKKGESVAVSVSSKEKQPVKKTKKKKLDYREFSRAPLREFQVVEMKAEEPVKVEKKKAEIKEQ
ncbi:MAG TPA: hypothetical protein VF487_00260 [Chitinophagaceae bacterium]